MGCPPRAKPFWYYKAIEAAGFLAYPGQTKRTHTCAEALKDFSFLYD